MTASRLYTPKKQPMRVAAFMSGAGTNLRRILELQRKLEAGGERLFEVSLIFSDSAGSNAKAIAEEFRIPCFVNDIREFYRGRGMEDRQDMALRKEYDRAAAQMLERYSADVVALCGYMSLLTGAIWQRYLTLNVHPADLTVLDEAGRRLYAGCMGAGCVAMALRRGEMKLRSTTHIVTEGLDQGPVLMRSEPVPVPAGAAAPGQHADAANALLEKLKEHGDWKIYPETIRRLAKGQYWLDGDRVLDSAHEKAELRSRLSKMRASIQAADAAKRSESITAKLVSLAEYRSAGTLMLYLSTEGEVQTDALAQQALEDGKRVAVPITDLGVQELRPCTLKSLERVKPGPFGVREPLENSEVESSELDMVVVPGVGFDALGNRLGRGLGYYDRFLKTTSATRIGLAFEEQMAERIMTDCYDVPMHVLITEKRTLRGGGNAEEN